MVRDSIRHAINSIRLKQKHQLNKLVILIKLVYPDNISSQDREYLEITLHKYLLDFRKEYAYDFSLHAVSNRFELDLDSDLYKSSFSRIQDLIAFLDQKGDLEFRLGAGFGKSLGESHYQAGSLLQERPDANRRISRSDVFFLAKCLKKQEAVKYGKNVGFVISGEDNALTGPLSLTRSLNYSYSNTKALDYSQSNGINESNLLKIVGLFQMDKDTIMTAASLSQWLNITSRSCNRILQQLLDSNLIEEIESQKQEGKGRPTRQYRFCKNNFIRTFF